MWYIQQRNLHFPLTARDTLLSQSERIKIFGAKNLIGDVMDEAVCFLAS
jgi:hypothetical protein